MDAAELLEELRVYLTGRGASLVACADIQAIPSELRDDFPRALLIAVALTPSIVAGISSGPTFEYLREYKRVNALLTSLAEDAAEYLQKAGWQAKAYLPSKGGAANEGLRTPLPHKTVATLSGAGWIGRCALLVTERFGSALRINRVLTDAPLTAGEPVTESLCGACFECVRACPAGAPQGGAWTPGMNREELFDAFACRDKAINLCPEEWDVRSICGICIQACPHTRRYLVRSGVTLAGNP